MYQYISKLDFEARNFFAVGEGRGRGFNCIMKLVLKKLPIRVCET